MKRLLLSCALTLVLAPILHPAAARELSVPVKQYQHSRHMSLRSKSYKLKSSTKSSKSQTQEHITTSLGLNKTDEPHKSSAYNYYLEESKGSKSSKKGLHSYLVNATNSTTATSNSSKSYRGTEESEDVSEGFTNSLFSAKAAKFIKEDEGDSGMSDLGDAETNSKLSRSNNSTNTTNTASNSISTNVDGLGQATANATLSFTAPSDPGLSPAGLSLASTQGYAWKEVSVAAVILIVSAWYL